jgi:hypothetical protein
MFANFTGGHSGPPLHRIYVDSASEILFRSLPGACPRSGGFSSNEKEKTSLCFQREAFAKSDNPCYGVTDKVPIFAKILPMLRWMFIKRKRKNLPLFPERGFRQTRFSPLQGNQYNPHIGQDPTHVGFAGLPEQMLKPAAAPAFVRNVHAGMVYCADVGHCARNAFTLRYFAWPSAYARVKPSE